MIKVSKCYRIKQIKGWSRVLVGKGLLFKIRELKEGLIKMFHLGKDLNEVKVYLEEYMEISRGKRFSEE